MRDRRSPAAHTLPTGDRWAHTRPETMQEPHAHSDSTACSEVTPGQVWPLGEASGLAVRSDCAPRRAQGRPCSRRVLSTEARCTRAGCRQSLGAVDAALCVRCLSTYISAYEARTANSEFSGSFRRAGMLMSAHLMHNTCPVTRDRI